jgi:co-chaperonin GroES (HSP10)
MISIRPLHDTVTLRPAPELHARLHGIQIDGGSIITELFGEVRLSQPVDYKITGKRNQFAFARVVRIAEEGSLTGQGQDRPDIAPGDVVGVDLGQIGHKLPGGLWQTSWRNLLCKFSEWRDMPTPLMNQIMVEYDQQLVDRYSFQNRNTTLTIPKIGPDDIKTNDRQRTRVGLTAGRVLATGPGRFVKKTLEHINVGPGDVVMFSNASGVVDFMFKRGQLLKFVAWSECESVIEGLE